MGKKTCTYIWSVQRVSKLQYADSWGPQPVLPCLFLPHCSFVSVRVWWSSCETNLLVSESNKLVYSAFLYYLILNLYTFVRLSIFSIWPPSHASCSGIRVWRLFLYPKFVDWRRQQQLMGKHFLGLINTDAKNVTRINDVSSNVASVLQFGELFGALGTPLSGNYSMTIPVLDF